MTAIKRCLYAGRKSRVWCANTKAGVRVALKGYLKAELTENDAVKVDRELALVMQLNHPNLVRGFATFSDQLGVYLVQELASRGDLCDVVRAFEKRCIPEVTVFHMVIFPLLRALSYLHEKRIIHRDIKPENLLVMTDGSVKLCDLGLAIDCRVDCPVSRVGTLEFMAPEVVRLKSRTAEELARLRRAQQPLYGTAVDLWAVGCVCYELLYGVALFRGESPSVVERKILFQPTQFFPRVSAAMTPVSSSAINFLSMALVANPQLRATADELQRYGWVASSQPQQAQAQQGEQQPAAGAGPALAQARSGAAAAAAASAADDGAQRGAQRQRATRMNTMPSAVPPRADSGMPMFEGAAVADEPGPRPGSMRDCTAVSEAAVALAAARLRAEGLTVEDTVMEQASSPGSSSGGGRRAAAAAAAGLEAGGAASRPGTPPQDGPRSRPSSIDVNRTGPSSPLGSRVVPDHPTPCPGCECCEAAMAGASSEDLLRLQLQRRERAIRERKAQEQAEAQQRQHGAAQSPGSPAARAPLSQQPQHFSPPSPDLSSLRVVRHSDDRRGDATSSCLAGDGGLWRSGASHRRFVHGLHPRNESPGSPREAGRTSQQQAALAGVSQRAGAEAAAGAAEAAAELLPAKPEAGADGPLTPSQRAEGQQQQQEQQHQQQQQQRKPRGSTEYSSEDMPSMGASEASQTSQPPQQPASPAKHIGRWSRVRRSLSHFSSHYLPALGFSLAFWAGDARRRASSSERDASGSSGEEGASGRARRGSTSTSGGHRTRSGSSVARQGSGRSRAEA